MSEHASLTSQLAAIRRIAALAWIKVLPALSIAVLALIAALPLGLPGDYRFAPAMAPLAAIHFWASRHLENPKLPTMPAWLAFTAGLVVDVTTNGPLGFWALIYLAGLAVTLVIGPQLAAAGLGRWLRFAAVATLMAVLQWLIASAYFGTVVDLQPIALATVLLVFVEPVLSRLSNAVLPALEARSAWVRGGL